MLSNHHPQVHKSERSDENLNSTREQVRIYLPFDDENTDNFKSLRMSPFKTTIIKSAKFHVMALLRIITPVVLSHLGVMIDQDLCQKVVFLNIRIYRFSISSFLQKLLRAFQTFEKPCMLETALTHKSVTG